MSACLDENLLLDFVDGLLSPADASTLESHIDTCARCRLLLAEVGRANADATGARSQPGASLALSRGARVDRYVVLEPVGAGGMGVVYAAHDPQLNRRVALKLVRGGAGRASNARVEREAQAMARLAHPNVIAVYDVGSYEGALFLAMEFVDGGTLKDLIATRPRWEDVLAVFVQAAHGLAAAHAVGIVHRDFKPDNVLLGRDGRARVSDFGLARASFAARVDPQGEVTRDRGAFDATLTRTGGIVGTPAYMAPEQMGLVPSDARADVFSFCVALYEGLYGERPFEGKSLEELMHAVAKGAVRPAPARTRVPPWLRRAVLGGLSARREERYPSMEALLHALRRPKRRGWIVASGAIVAAAGLAIAAVALRSGAVAAPVAETAGTTAGSASGASSASPSRPLALTEQPDPQTSSPEALLSYQKAMQGLRDGTRQVTHLKRALDLDPKFAAAHLRLATLLADQAPDDARTEYGKALERKSDLNAHDRALLEALEPYLVPAESDLVEFERRLVAVAAQFDGDAEVMLYLGLVRTLRGDREGTARAYDRALETDPKFANVWSLRGQVKAYLGDMDAAVESFTRCIALVPASSACHWHLAQINATAGRCTDLEADARRWVTVGPDSALAYHELANALAGMNRSSETIEEALRQSQAHIAPTYRTQRESLDKLAFAELRGRFDLAERHAGELEAVIATDNNETLHALAARARVDIAREIGDTAAAGRVADDFLRRREAWAAERVGVDIALAYDPTPVFLAAKRNAGLLAPPEYERELLTWLTRMQGAMRPWYGSYLWLHGVAAPVETAAEAKHAIAMLPTFGEARTHRPRTLADATIGKVYLLAGRAAEAIPMLRRAVASCLALEFPMAHVRAELDLGRALEATGDVPAACASYARVAERWAGAAPRSISVEAAVSRREALGCSASPTSLAVGDHVAAPWPSGPVLYFATVFAVDAGAANIQYMDGGSTRDGVKLAQMTALPIRTWKPGDPVRAVWRDIGKFYDGRVIAVGEGTCTVAWDDGSPPTDVDVRKIMTR